MADSGNRTSSSAVRISTTWGTIEIKLVDGKVAACTLPYLADLPNVPFRVKPGSRNPVSRFVESVLAGRKAERPPLIKPQGTPFQQQIWQAIALIPHGTTMTYGDLARAVGRPRAYRAAANACGKNPLSLFIPCHRVVAANGKSGGFSSGMPWKYLLLSAEKNRPDS